MSTNIYIENMMVAGFTFPGGERHITLPYNFGTRELRERGVRIVADLKNSDDIMDLLLTGDALKAIRTPIRSLEIVYFPYARQDRIANPLEAHSLRVMAGLINSLEAQRVLLLDPHSIVAEALINNVEVIDVTDLLTDVDPEGGEYLWDEYIADYNMVLVAPDAGAEKKVLRLAKTIGSDMEVATKVRDTSTGQIIETRYHPVNTIKGRKVKLLIVDDICDGGRTFIELAKVLRRTYSDVQIGLFVTHGIFSKGLDVFDGLIDDVFTTAFNDGKLTIEKVK